MAEKVSRQIGNCRAGDGGLPGSLRLLLCKAEGETGQEVVGESVRSINSRGDLGNLATGT